MYEYIGVARNIRRYQTPRVIDSRPYCNITILLLLFVYLLHLRVGFLVCCTLDVTIIIFGRHRPQPQEHSSV
jgi:hypothetical protein